MDGGDGLTKGQSGSDEIALHRHPLGAIRHTLSVANRLERVVLYATSIGVLVQAGRCRVQPCDVVEDRPEFRQTRIGPWREAASEGLLENWGLG